MIECIRVWPCVCIYFLPLPACVCSQFESGKPLGTLADSCKRGIEMLTGVTSSSASRSVADASGNPLLFIASQAMVAYFQAVNNKCKVPQLQLARVLALLAKVCTLLSFARLMKPLNMCSRWRFDVFSYLCVVLELCITMVMSCQCLQDDTSGILASVMAQYCESVPTWLWTFWIPQLLSCLSRNEERPVKKILQRLALQYPQALYYTLRAFVLERREVSGSTASNSQSSDLSADSQRAANGMSSSTA